MNIWFFNHYATDTFFDQGGRHFWLARELVKLGHKVTIFAASTVHGRDEKIAVPSKGFKMDSIDDVRYVFIRARNYSGNGKARILNMIDYYRGLMKHALKFERPDVIMGSSVHPLAQIAALKLSKRMRCKCILETRDLWPASLEEYGVIKTDGIIARMMYLNERKCYAKADALIFTMEGGARYIQDKGWDVGSGGKIDLTKVYHINNGIDIEAFDRNASTVGCDVQCLNDGANRKIIYAGSIRKVNDIGFLVNVAKEMQEDDVDFVILGDGDERESLLKMASELKLDNIFFPGAVAKKAIPACLKRATLLLQWSASQSGISRYGMSLNKLFDYLAAGKPVLANLPSEYSIVNSFDCGIERMFSDPAQYADQIRRMLADQDVIDRWGDNARKTAEKYSFARHADKFIQIIENITKEEQ